MTSAHAVSCAQPRCGALSSCQLAGPSPGLASIVNLDCTNMKDGTPSRTCSSAGQVGWDGVGAGRVRAWLGNDGGGMQGAGVHRRHHGDGACRGGLAGAPAVKATSCVTYDRVCSPARRFGSAGGEGGHRARLTALVQVGRQVLLRRVHARVQSQEDRRLIHLHKLRRGGNLVVWRCACVCLDRASGRGQRGAGRTLRWICRSASERSGPVAYQPTTSCCGKVCLSAGLAAGMVTR